MPECGVDPAVGVHDSGGDIVNQAVDGVADEGLGGDEEVGGEDGEHGGLAVQLEDSVVDRDLFGPVVESNPFQSILSGLFNFLSPLDQLITT